MFLCSVKKKSRKLTNFPCLLSTVQSETAAVFFITYEKVKTKLHGYKSMGPNGNAHVVSHMIAASLGEIASCIVRVPYEVVKMRSQTSDAKVVSNTAIMRDIMAREGLSGLYRGFSSTVIRDLPFSALQYPIWERLKARHYKRYQRQATAGESAYYGSIAGGIAAFITTPLDVAKSRIMLAERTDTLASGKVLTAIRAVRDEKGIRGLFAGVVPRVIWISVGAAIFLGSYEEAITLLTR
jgi:solute carrier family 25 S-adenosylmethionine transporter 26